MSLWKCDAFRNVLLWGLLGVYRYDYYVLVFLLPTGWVCKIWRQGHLQL